MASKPVGPSALSSASVEMVGRAHEGVVQVRTRGRGAGAGVIWGEEGLVLTNHHVVAGGRRGARVRVVVHDGKTFGAEVVKRGRELDLALLRLEEFPGDLPAIPVELPASLRSANREAAEAGLMIAAVEAEGPGGRAGLLVGDVLLGVGDGTPDDAETFLDEIARAGDAVRLRVMRGGKISFVDVRPGARGRAA